MTAEKGAARSSAEIHDQFRGLIASGRLGAGERLPTVRQVALDLGVAPGTAAKAFKMLEADGLVVTRVGFGTTVASDSAKVSGSTVRQVRKLVETSQSNDDSLEDVVSILRTLWPR